MFIDDCSIYLFTLSTTFFFKIHFYMPYSNKISFKVINTKCSLNDFLQLLLTPQHIISVITVNMLPGVYICVKLELHPFVFMLELLILGDHFIKFYHNVKNYTVEEYGAYFRSVVAQNLRWRGRHNKRTMENPENVQICHVKRTMPPLK